MSADNPAADARDDLEDSAPPPYEEPRIAYDGRKPPQNIEAERGVLGAMLLSRQAIDEVASIIYPRDFYLPIHETIYEAILDLYGRGDAVDVITVTGELTSRGLLDRVGGSLAIFNLSEATPLAANATYYADLVAEAAMFRRLTEFGQRTAQRAYSMSGESSAAYEETLRDLTRAEGPTRGEDYVAMSELLPYAIEQIESLSYGTGGDGVPTGFIDLDGLFGGGLKSGQMIVVAGRPAMGKSTLAADFCRAAAIRHGVPTCYFSLEMERVELTKRIISAESRVTLDKMASGLLSDADWMKVAQHMDAIIQSPLFIDDSPNLTMSQIAAKARRLKAQHGLGFMVIDYLQLMSSGARVENRQTEVSEFSRQIKLLSKELGIPIVALSQLNRGPEQRTNKRPVMSDLRESGSIEQDADIVILVHRDDMYEVESSRPGEADLIVAKHRNGPTKDVVVVAQLHYARFVDMAPDAP